MRYWRLKPAATLRSRVLCYGLVDPYAQRPLPEETAASWDQQLLLPDGYSEIVFRLSGSFERRSISGGGVSVMESSYLIGGRSQSVLTRNLSEVQLACIKLDSRFLRRIIGVPLSQLRDSTLTLRDLNCRPLLDLEDAYLNARSVESAQECFDTFFLRALRTAERRDASVDELVRQIRVTHGALSIMSFARAVNLDARTLERKFIADMGLTPKQYSSIMRFKRGYCRRILAPPQPAMPNAHLEGYYDQSHFDRDFRKFVGQGPHEKLGGRAGFVTAVSDHLLEGELAGSSRFADHPEPV
jgi:methylphosphotriester-DNA--protein-cysteine methyltransferase